jgi:hypothetical protein
LRLGADYCVREQGTRRGGDIVLPHQALTDEESADARCGEPGEIGMGEHAAFGDHQTVVRHKRREALGGGKARGEGLEVAVVDADQLRVELTPG